MQKNVGSLIWLCLIYGYTFDYFSTRWNKSSVLWHIVFWTVWNHSYFFLAIISKLPTTITFCALHTPVFLLLSFISAGAWPGLLTALLNEENWTANSQLVHVSMTSTVWVSASPVSICLLGYIVIVFKKCSGIYLPTLYKITFFILIIPRSTADLGVYWWNYPKINCGPYTVMPLFMEK